MKKKVLSALLCVSMVATMITGCGSSDEGTGAVASGTEAAAPAASGAEGSVKVAAPMPGKILAIKANAGQAVKRGDVIMILEAMKMENEITAPEDGTIAGINVAVGDSVESGDTLASLN